MQLSFLPPFPPRHRTDYSRLAVLASYTLLALELVVSNPLSVLPLLLFAWGVVTAHWRSHIWLCFALLFYFMANINNLAESPTWLDYAETALIAILFVAAMLYCRWSKSISPEAACS